MKVYPLNFNDFIRDLSTEQQCIDYLHELRWQGGFICPRCQCNRAWQISDIKYKCQNCGYQSTLTSGTLLQGTHLPLTLWFKAVWYIVSCQDGTKISELQRCLNLSSYRTALSMVNKIRIAMADCDNQKLFCNVFVDEIPINAKGSLVENNALIAVEVNDAGKFHIRMKSVGDFSSTKDVTEFIYTNIKKGSIIHTAGFYSFTEIPVGYRIKKEKRKSGSNYLPPVYDVLRELRNRGLLGQKQVSCSSKNTDEYLGECCYKFNRQNVSVETIFQEILKTLLTNNIL